MNVQELIDILNTVEDKSRLVWAEYCDLSNGRSYLKPARIVYSLDGVPETIIISNDSANKSQDNGRIVYRKEQ